MATTQQDTIKDLVTSLTLTSNTGTAAMDEAVKQFGYQNFEALRYSLFHDRYKSNAISERFLENYCGIRLNNRDTGAMTGLDAGGAKEKTTDSILPETTAAANLTNAQYQSFSKKGLKVNVSYAEEHKVKDFFDAAILLEKEKYIVRNLYSWWVGNALDLVDASLGINFTDGRASTKELDVKFIDDPSGNTPVEFDAEMDYGRASKLTLTINMHYYTQLASSDRNGTTAVPGNDASYAYLDRLVLDSLAEAALASNVNYFYDLPKGVQKGLVAVVGGMDDRDKDGIIASADNCYDTAYSLSGTDDGYILMRYLARQGASTSLPAGVTVSEDGQTLLVSKDFQGSIDASEYSQSIRSLDASGDGPLQSTKVKAITLKGNGADNIIWGADTRPTNIYGQKGNDILYGGEHKDTFWYANGDGKDTIYNYTPGKDTLRLISGSVSKATVSGKDVVLKIGSGSVRIKNGKGKQIEVIDTNGTSFFQTYTGNRGAGLSYSNAETLKVTNPFKGTIDATNASKLKTIDASKATKTVNIKGNKLANTIKASGGGGDLYGQKGNDTLYGGKGKDVFWYANGDGNDTIYNYTAGKDTIHISSGSISKATVSGKDVILKIGSGSMRLKNAKGKNISIIDANGLSYTQPYTASKSVGISYSGAANVKVAKAFTGSMVDASNASKVKTINASAVTKNLTIKGNKLANTIKAGSGGSNIYGQKGNDILYGGKGKDVFWYAKGDGKDTIYNYTAGKDKIRLTSGSISKATVSGKDVILKIGSGSICVKNAKGKKITVTDAKGKTTSKVYGNASTSKMLASDSYALEEESTKYVSASSQVLDNVARIPAAFDSALAVGKNISGSNSTNPLSLATSTAIAPESRNSTNWNASGYRS